MKIREVVNPHTQLCLVITVLGCATAVAQQNSPRPITDKDVVKMTKVEYRKIVSCKQSTRRATSISALMP